MLKSNTNKNREQTYHRLRPLDIPGNNLLLLLTWTSTASGQPLEVLSEWASSGQSSELYQRLIRDFQDSQTIEQLGLIVIALLCHERLLPYSFKETTEPIRGSYLADLDTLLQGQSLSNKRTVFERLAFSFLRVLTTFGDKYIDMISLFVTTLNTDAPLLERFDGLADQYVAARVGKDKLIHRSAWEGVGGLSLMEAIRVYETEWVLVPTPGISKIIELALD